MPLVRTIWTDALVSFIGSLTATQAILYFNALGPGQTVTLNYRLRAKYPIRAHTFESKVYEYYQPEIKATAKPVEVEVTRRK